LKVVFKPQIKENVGILSGARLVFFSSGLYPPDQSLAKKQDMVSAGLSGKVIGQHQAKIYNVSFYFKVTLLSVRRTIV
jgi:hypothetical protein